MSSSFQSGYQYSNVPAIDDPLSVSGNESDSGTPMTSISSHQQPNIPPELQAPSSMNLNQQQQQHQEQQEPYRATGRAYTPSYQEYPQNAGGWENIGGTGINISAGAFNDRRNRFMIGAVVILFLFIATHHGGDSSGKINASHTTTVTTKETIDKDSVFNEESDDVNSDSDITKSSSSSSTKGVAGGNPVPIPSINNSPVSSIDVHMEEDDDFDDVTNPAPTSTLPLPTLTYLLTYPMSGTTYTVNLLELTTNTNTATNHDDIFVRDNFPPAQGTPTGTKINAPLASKTHPSTNLTAPLWHSANTTLPRPTRHILTQTHCDGYFSTSTVITTRSFDVGCRTVHHRSGNSGVTPRFHWDTHRRTIHLVRDPFSNVVSKFHAWRWEEALNNGGVIRVRNFGFHSLEEEDRLMFREHCKLLDAEDAEYEWSGFVVDGDEEVLELLGTIPCGMEFLKYVRWHVLARRMKHSVTTDESERRVVSDAAHSSFSSASSLTIYYEDFADKGKTDAVIAMMAGFLELDNVDFSKRPDFVAGRVYNTGYFTEIEKDAVGRLVRILLEHDSHTWDLLKGYFN